MKPYAWQDYNFRKKGGPQCPIPLISETMETKKGCGQKDQNNRGHLGKEEPDCHGAMGSPLRILGGF